MSKIRMAILGCGGMAGGHAQSFARHPDVELVGLCDVSEEVVERFIETNLKEHKPTPPVFTDAALMYSQSRPDAVTIVTPHTLHFEHAMQALDAGCHVLMEKPMVTNSDHAHELAAKVKEKNKIFVIGYNTPCTPVFNYIRDAIRSNALGKLELVTGWLAQGWKTPTIGTWRQKPELSGGGQMYDSGAHIFNSLVWTVEQPVEAVQAFVDNQDAPVDINGTANIRFKNGVLATLTIGGNCPANGSQLAYLFDRGRIECDGWSGSWIKVLRVDEENAKRSWGHTIEEVEPELDKSSSTPGENFIDAILGRAEPRTSPINGVIQSELMDAIYESARTGQVARPKQR